MIGYRSILTMNTWSVVRLPDIRRIAAALAMHSEIGFVVLGFLTAMAAAKAFLTTGRAAACRVLGWDAQNRGRTGV